MRGKWGANEGQMRGKRGAKEGQMRGKRGPSDLSFKMFRMAIYWTKWQSIEQILIEQLEIKIFGKSSFVELTDVECSIDLVKLTFCSIKNIQCWIGTLFNL